MNTQFYAQLPTQDGFHKVTELEHFQVTPDTWSVLISDVQGSTIAIERGKYRDVNMVGASCIIAVLNALKGIEIPFVFGGDGATMLIPNEYVPQAKKALAGTRKMAKETFQLQLRVGVVPVSEITATGQVIHISKIRVSPNYAQAVLTGGGASFAETLVKTKPEYLISEDEECLGDFSGLECRWKDIPSPKGEVHSWLILALSHDSKERAKLYSDIIQSIENIYGHPDQQGPVTDVKMKLTISPWRVLKEVRVKFQHLGRWDFFKQYCESFIGNCLGLYFFTFKTNHFQTDWDKYKKEIPVNTDFRKFDDMLRLTLSGTIPMKESMLKLLGKYRKEAQIAYGLHVADSTLMTCLVFSRQGQHIHFVDANKGGYALAAKQLKAQLRGR